MTDTRIACFILLHNLFLVKCISLPNTIMETQGILEWLKNVTVESVIGPEHAKSVPTLLGPLRVSAAAPGHNNTRVKRAGSGKLGEASQTSNLKTMRMLFQMLGNPFSSAPQGGAHPLHPTAVKPAMKLFRTRVLDFLDPPEKASQKKS